MQRPLVKILYLNFLGEKKIERRIVSDIIWRLNMT